MIGSWRRVAVASLLILVCPTFGLGAPGDLPVTAAQAQARAHFAHQLGEDRIPPKDTRYAAEHCDPVPPNSPLWASVLKPYVGLPVQVCTSNGSGLTSRALLLLPTAEQLSRWVVTACVDAGQGGAKLASCWKGLADDINADNGFIFVVSGLIREPKSICVGQKIQHDKPACAKTLDDEVLYSFRDGITAHLVGQSETCLIDGPLCSAVQPTDEAAAAFLEAPVLNYRNAARVSGLYRDDYARCAGVPLPDDATWVSVVRSSVLAAWSSDREPLISMRAKAKYGLSQTCALTH